MKEKMRMQINRDCRTQNTEHRLQIADCGLQIAKFKNQNCEQNLGSKLHKLCVSPPFLFPIFKSSNLLFYSFLFFFILFPSLVIYSAPVKNPSEVCDTPLSPLSRGDLEVCLHSNSTDKNQFIKHGGKELKSDNTVLYVTKKQLEHGIAITLDGHPYYIQKQIEKSTKYFWHSVQKENINILVVIIPEPSSQSKNTPIIIPVSIEDKTLAKGAALKLTNTEGKEVVIKIPPRKVLFSIPFYLYPGNLVSIGQESTSNTSEPNNTNIAKIPPNLVIQVIPRITKKAQVSVDNTAEEGLSATIRYEGLAYLKFKDLLNRTNRRDLDGTFFTGKGKKNRWSFFSRNLFEKFDKRDFGLAREQYFTDNLQTKFRIDNLQNISNANVGVNLQYNIKKNRSILIGNIDRITKNTSHTEITVKQKNIELLTRFEGVEIKRKNRTAAGSFTSNKIGYLVKFQPEKQLPAITLGTLKIQNYDDYGEIDDYFNFAVNYTANYGEEIRGWNITSPKVSGDINLELMGRGSSSWLRSEINTDISFQNNFTLFIRANDDFLRFTGRQYKILWENRFISIMKTRNFFDKRDILNKFGIDSIFMDFRFNRESKGSIFTREEKYGLAKYIHIWKYDIPLEIFLEKRYKKETAIGINLSIRQYL